IEAMALIGLVGPMHAKAIESARADLGHPAVPDLVAILGQLDARRLSLAPFVEQADLDLRRVRGEKREVDSFAVPRGALRIGQAFLHRGELQLGRVHVVRTMTRKCRAAKCAIRTRRRPAASLPAAGCRREPPCAALRSPPGAGSCAARRGRPGAKAPGEQTAGCG